MFFWFGLFFFFLEYRVFSLFSHIRESLLKWINLAFTVAPVTMLLLNWCLMLNLFSISVSLSKCSDILQIANMAVIFTDIFTDSTSFDRRLSQVLLLNFDSMLVTMPKLGTFILIFKICWNQNISYTLAFLLLFIISIVLFGGKNCLSLWLYKTEA